MPAAGFYAAFFASALLALGMTRSQQPWLGRVGVFLMVVGGAGATAFFAFMARQVTTLQSRAIEVARDYPTEAGELHRLKAHAAELQPHFIILAVFALGVAIAGLMIGRRRQDADGLSTRIPAGATSARFRRRM